MNWIKRNPRLAASYVGGSFVVAGILMMLPRSPWTLIVVGCAVLFFTFVSIFDEGPN